MRRGLVVGRPATRPGYRLSPVRRWVRGRASAGRGGGGSRCCGTGGSRTAPTTGVTERGARGRSVVGRPRAAPSPPGGGVRPPVPPSRASVHPSISLRANGFPGPAPLPWLPAFAGTTMEESGRASAAGDGGVGVPLRRRAVREPPYDGVWELAMRRGLVVGAPRHVRWIPAFAGKTVGVWGPASAGRGGRRVPLRRALAGGGFRRNDASGRPFDRLRANGARGHGRRLCYRLRECGCYGFPGIRYTLS